MGLPFTIVAGPRQRIHSQVRVPQDSWPHFTSSDSSLPQPEGQVPVLISPRKRMAQLYPQALGSLSVAFYDSQGYGGGDSNQPPHPGGQVCYALSHKFEADWIQNTAPNSASTFCVRIRCRAGMNWSSLMLRPTVSRPVRPGTKHPPPDFHHCHTVAGLSMRGASRREDGSTAHNHCRSSPAQSISSQSPAGPATTLRRLRFETSSFLASYDSQGNGGDTRPRFHIGLVISITFLSYGPCMWHYCLCTTFRVRSQWAQQTFEVVICVLHWSKPISQMYIFVSFITLSLVLIYWS
jgi:hypothetical protein